MEIFLDTQFMAIYWSTSMPSHSNEDYKETKRGEFSFRIAADNNGDNFYFIIDYLRNFFC